MTQPQEPAAEPRIPEEHDATASLAVRVCRIIRQRIKWLGRWPFLVLCSLQGFIAVWVILYACWRIANGASLYWVGAAIGLFIAANLIAAADIVRYRHAIAKDRDYSPVVDKLLLGDVELARIYDFTPWPWSLFVGLRPRSFSDWVHLVANNLDWYLTAPRLHFRLYWAVFAVYFVGMLALVGLSISGVWQATDALISLMAVYGISAFHHSGKSLAGMLALDKYLREYFSEDLPET